MLVYGGLDDPHATRDELLDWHRHTTQPGLVRQFPGGHFFLQSAAADVLTALAADVSTVLATAPAESDCA